MPEVHVAGEIDAGFRGAGDTCYALRAGAPSWRRGVTLDPGSVRTRKTPNHMHTTAATATEQQRRELT